MDDYDEMLDDAHENMPEEVFEEARFEIPEAETRKEGNKTILTNFADIAETLNRDHDHLSKFLQGQLGTAGHIDGKQLVLQGKSRRGLINAKIEQYTDTYVICDECGRPDTSLRKEKGVTIMKCEACGARDSLDE